VPEAQIVETLIEEAMRIASEKDTERGPNDPSGSPVVTVS
jgi:(E)-4-hydroxy-3-methylbut-2-enyl-diphosphate synthase